MGQAQFVNLDDDYLFEMLILQLFQSGLNWRVILHKRENFRKAFKNFDPVGVATLTEQEVGDLMLLFRRTGDYLFLFAKHRSN